jgi:Zn finger protein HypA/HybF involved in hydrogenase expression
MTHDNTTVNRFVSVDPPAARVCEDCGHVEKVERLMLISRQRDRCKNCGSNRLVVDSWEHASSE